jgi:hypothetical protein
MNDGLPYYDAVVRDLFQKDHPSLLDQLTGGVRIKAFLNIDLAKVLERCADLVLLLEDKTVLHIEFQSANDKDMAYRAGIYCVLLGHKYRCRVRQVVLYIGPAKMRMAVGVDRPGDLALAMLARGGPDRVAEIIRRANELGAAERQRARHRWCCFAGCAR